MIIQEVAVLENILLVEDDASLIRSLHSYLTEEGFSVVAVD